MLQSQRTDDGLGSHSWRPWIVPLTLGGLGLAIALIGTYVFDWTWTGFRGNTLWDWLHLLIVPGTLGIAAIWFTQNHRWRPQWTLLLWSLLGVLVLLEIATYLFNWRWTGFKGNKIWDWLNLLLLPLVLMFVSVWFAAPHRWRSWWTSAIWASLLVLALLALGSYLFGWSWTGFKGNTLWDWLSMLLVPVVLTTATIWFTAPAMRRMRARARSAETQEVVTQPEVDETASSPEEAAQA